MSSYRRYIVARGVLIGFLGFSPCGFMWAYKGRQGLLIVIGNFCCKTVPLHRYPAKARYFFALPLCSGIKRAVSISPPPEGLLFVVYRGFRCLFCADRIKGRLQAVHDIPVALHLPQQLPPHLFVKLRLYHLPPLRLYGFFVNKH